MIELIKYLSPAALVGITWGIYQYFDKKKSEKNESRRKEKIKNFEKLQSKLNELRYILIEPHTLITKSTRILNSYLMKYEKETSREIKILEEIYEKIDALEENTIDNNRILIEQNEKIIDSLNERRLESTKFLSKEIESVINHLSPIPEKLELKTSELNEIPILGMPRITSKILILTLKLKEISNIIKTNDTHSDLGKLSEEFTDCLIDATDKIIEIESELNSEMK